MVPCEVVERFFLSCGLVQGQEVCERLCPLRGLSEPSSRPKSARGGMRRAKERRRAKEKEKARKKETKKEREKERQREKEKEKEE